MAQKSKISENPKNTYRNERRKSVLRHGFFGLFEVFV